MADSIKTESINGIPNCEQQQQQLEATIATSQVVESSSDDDDEFDDDDDDDDDEQENGEENFEDLISCIFCGCNDNEIIAGDGANADGQQMKMYANVEAAIAHLKDGHQFDLRQLKIKFNMDQYSYIKMINFIRTSKSNTAELILNANECLWESDEYLKPILEFDDWLVYDFENMYTSSSVSNTTSECPLTMEQFLLNKVEELKEELKKKNNELHQASMDMQLMRNSFNHLLEKIPNSNVVTNVNQLNTNRIINNNNNNINDNNTNNNNNTNSNNINRNAVKKPIKNRSSKDSSKSSSSSSKIDSMQSLGNSVQPLLENIPNSNVAANVNQVNKNKNKNISNNTKNNNNNTNSNNNNNSNVIKKPKIKYRSSKDSSKSSTSSTAFSASLEYFTSYNHYGIHYDMISDTVRTESYRNAILNNKDLIKNKIIMDLGCGTSILSLFAAEAGAKIVYAIDDSEIVYDAMDIGRINNMNTIRYIKGRIENVNLHNGRIKEKVDIIISEWMGYFLLYEGMLDSVIYARDNWLTPNGQLLPNRCTISLCAYGDEKRYNEYIKFWDNVHGYDMTTIKEKVYAEAQLEVCDPKCILSVDSICLADFDIMTVTTDAPNFTKPFTFEMGQHGQLTAFVGWFDTFFNLPNKIEFSTSPKHPSTHWKQVIFYLAAPVPVKAGDKITGVFKCERDPKYVRGLNMQLTVFNRKYNYYLE